MHVGRENEAVYGERALAMSLGISDRVRFLGARDDVPRLLEGADVFVMCSHREGLGLSCVEALVKGVPAVVTDVPGLSDLAKHIPLCEKTPMDEAAFAAKILDLTSRNRASMAMIKEKSKEAIERMFGMATNLCRYIDLWKVPSNAMSSK